MDSHLIVADASLDYWVKLAQIIGAAAVPIVLASVGFYVNRTLQQRNLAKDYVDIALRVLSQEKLNKNDPLRQWASVVLRKFSPVNMSDHTLGQLVASRALLPAKLILESTLVTNKSDPEQQLHLSITNQGGEMGTNIRISCELPEAFLFLHADGPTPSFFKDSVVSYDPLPSLEPRGRVTYRVRFKTANSSGFIRMSARSDQDGNVICRPNSIEL